MTTTSPTGRSTSLPATPATPPIPGRSLPASVPPIPTLRPTATLPPLVTLECATELSSTPFTERSFCDAERVSAPPEATCKRAGSEGVLSFVNIRNGYTEDSILSVNVTHPTTGARAAKYESSLQLSVDHPEWFERLDDSLGEAGFFRIDGTRLADSGFKPPSTVAFQRKHEGCVEIWARNYARPRPIEDQRFNPFPDDKPSTQTAANLSFKVPSGTAVGSFLLGMWEDRITRQGTTVDGSGNPIRQGIAGSDGVTDWVQIHAWDIYQHFKYQFPNGGVGEPVDASQLANIHIGIDEFNEVFGSVEHVFDSWGGDVRVPGTTEWLTNTQLRDLYNSLDGPENNHAITISSFSGTTSSNWIASSNTGFNLMHPELRTGQLLDIDSGATSIHTGYHRIDGFFHSAAHESRHAWQAELLVRSNSPPIATADCATQAGTYFEHECFAGLMDRNPDNNDDIRFYDEAGNPLPGGDSLPERTILLTGQDVGGPTGSGGELIDDGTNREFGLAIAGENPDAPGVADPRDLAAEAIERDAIRFARALEGNLP